MTILDSDTRKPAPYNAMMIARLKGDGTDRWIHLGVQDGLYVRVRPNGTKTFVVKMKLRGGRNIVKATLGPAEGPAALTLREAKLAAAAKLSGRSKAGVNLDVKEALGQFFAEHVEPRWK